MSGTDKMPPFFPLQRSSTIMQCTGYRCRSVRWPDLLLIEAPQASKVVEKVACGSNAHGRSKWLYLLLSENIEPV